MKYYFIAKYTDSKGIKRTIRFNRSEFDEEKAKALLEEKGIKNFFFFFESFKPELLTENTYLFKGEIGWDITTEVLLPFLNAGNDIVIDSFGGDLWEGLKIYDTIKELELTNNIKVLGSCASAATFPFLAVPIANRQMSENSRFLIHNAWTWEEGNQYDLRRTAEDLAKEDDNIATIYAKESNLSKEEILSLMKEEKFLNRNDVVKLGFITGEAIEDNNNNNKNNNIDMTDAEKNEVQAKLSGVEKALNMISSLFKGKEDVTNIVLQDTNGVELDFGSDIETEDQITTELEGITANGETANGSYVMSSGQTYVIADGVLTDIIEAEPEVNEEVEALTVENEALKTENAEKAEEITNLIKERDAFKASFDDISGQIKALQSDFSKIKDKGNTPAEPIAPKLEEERSFTFKRKNSKK